MKTTHFVIALVLASLIIPDLAFAKMTVYRPAGPGFNDGGNYGGGCIDGYVEDDGGLCVLPQDLTGNGNTDCPDGQVKNVGTGQCEAAADDATRQPSPQSSPSSVAVADLSAAGAPNCLEPLKQIKTCEQDIGSCDDTNDCDVNKNVEAQDTKNKFNIKSYKVGGANSNGALDGRLLRSCNEFFTLNGEPVLSNRAITGESESGVFSTRRLCASSSARGSCWQKLSGLVGKPEAAIKQAQQDYMSCVNKGLKESLLVMQRCMALNDGMTSITEFKGGKKIAAGPAYCHAHDGEALDYPSCAHFAAWYTGLLATETGLKTYNEGAKVVTGMKAQNQASQAIANGQGQEAAIDASKATTMASADSEGRLKVFYLAKAGAIGAQLASIVTPSKAASKCKTGCCELFDKSAQQGGFGKSVDYYFPNQSMKDQLTAELIKAGGDAALAAMKEAELKRQANAMQAIKNQMTAPTGSQDEGIMRYCVANPSDSRCQTPGMRESLAGTNLTGANFGGENFGMNNAGQLAEEDLSAGDGGAAAVSGKPKPVGDIGGMNKEAAAAKDIFNAPAAVRGGTGAIGSSGGGGSANVSSSAGGLSKDPGLEADKKDAPIKVTTAGAAYDNSVGYAGGGWRAGTGKKEEVTANPFAAMFGKDKGRDPASVPDIDSPASDLFTKISNRYGEVQKRKALMDVR